MSKNLLSNLACSGTVASISTLASMAHASEQEVAPLMNHGDVLNPIASPAIAFAAAYGVAVMLGVLALVSAIAVISTIASSARKRMKGT